MDTSAYWLSKQEKVVVESIVDTSVYGKYSSTRFRVRTPDGSIITVDRSDIILDEEQTLIDELANILYNSKLPVKHERYAAIMRQFIVKGVPYVSKLQNRKPQQLDLFHAG